MEWGGAFSVSAQTPSPPGVVIRERIEIGSARPADAPSAAFTQTAWTFTGVSGALSVQFGPHTGNPYPNQTPTGAMQCGSPITSPVLRVRFQGSRQGQTTDVALAPFILSQAIVGGYPECGYLYSAVLADVNVSLGDVADGDVVEVEYLSAGYVLPLDASAAFHTAEVNDETGDLEVAAVAFSPAVFGAQFGTFYGLLDLTPDALALTADPDTVAAGGEVRFTVDAPGLDPATPVTLSVPDLTLGGFVADVPVARGTARRSVTVERVMTVTRPLSEVAGVVFLAAEEAPDSLATVMVTASAGGRSGTIGVVLLPLPGVRFIRQDDTLVPTDFELADEACLRVSKFVTYEELRESTGFTSPYAMGQRDSGDGDRDTYRPQATGVDPALGPNDIQFRVQNVRTGYDELFGAVGDLAAPGTYRGRSHLRLVSNMTPSGAPFGAMYDDGVRGRQTILAALGDEVLVTLQTRNTQTGAFEVAAATAFPVSRPAAEAGPNAIRTATLAWQTFDRVSSSPDYVRDRMSEDWAQASIRFENAGVSDTFSDEVDDNVILVDLGRGADRRGLRTRGSGTNVLEIEVAVGTANRTLQLSYGANQRLNAVVASLVQQIAAQLNIDPFSVQFQPAVTIDETLAALAPPPVATRFFIVIAPGSGISVLRARGDRVVGLQTQDFTFNSLAFHELAAIGRNVRDAAESTIDIVVVPNGALRGARGNSLEVKGKGISRLGDTAGVPNIIYLSHDGADDDDGYPMIAGHEAGHVLLSVGHERPVGDPNAGAPFGPRELMSGATTDPVEKVDSAKRLTDALQARARVVSATPTNSILH